MRNHRYRRIALLAAALAVVTAACSNPMEPADDLMLTSLSETADAAAGGVQTETTWVIRDQDEFQRIWDRLFAARTDRPMPAVDFATQMVLVVAMGPQPTTGYAVRITGLSRTGRGIVAHVTTIAPGPNCGVALVLTHPVAISRVRKTDRPVQFEFTRTTRDCDAR